MGNLLVDAAQRQTVEAIVRLQHMIDSGAKLTTRQIYVKRAIASVDALKASLKAL